MKPWLLIIALLLIAFTAYKAFAINCHVDNTPFVLSSRPAAVCGVNSGASECVTYLSNPENDLEIWGLMPKPYEVEGVGRVNAYIVDNGSVAVEFSRFKLYQGLPVTGNVACGAETYKFNFTPEYADFQQVGEAGKTMFNNTGYIVAALFLVTLILVVIKILRG